jgi:hypothetical protein
VFTVFTMVVPEFNYESMSLDMTVQGFNSELLRSFPKQINRFIQHLEHPGCVGNASVVFPLFMRSIKKMCSQELDEGTSTFSEAVQIKK